MADFYIAPWDSGRSFRHLFESLPDAVLMVDAQGTIRLANTQAVQMFGYSAKELQGMGVEALLPERFRGGHAGYRLRYFDAPQVRPMGRGLQLWGLRRDGTEFPVEISLSPFETSQERMVFAAVRDVSQSRREIEALTSQNAQLQEANQKLAAEVAALKSAATDLRRP